VRKTLFTVLLIICISNIYSQVSEYNEVPITLEEKWEINGINYNIKQTVITGNRLFTVHVIVDHKPEMDEYNKNIAKKIARYAIEYGYLENALQYNTYSSQFNIFDSIVGIALIYIDETQENRISGSRFVIERDEFTDIEVKTIPLPLSFNRDEQVKLFNKIDSIISSRYFEDLIDLYSPNALDDIDVEDTKLKTTMNFSLAKEISIQEEGSFIVYIGSKAGVKGFQYFIPMEIIPISDLTKTIKGYIHLQIIDEKPKYGIYGVTLNVVDINDWSLMVQVGEQQVPIKQR